MTLDEAFAALGRSDGSGQEDAMEAVLAAWDEGASRCRALLHGYVCGADISEQTSHALFFVVPMLGEKADTAAFKDLCELAGDGERADLVLGDALLETMPRVLISCFGGDTGPLRRMIAREAADPVARGSVLLATAYLAATRRVPRTEMHAFLSDMFDDLPDEDPFVCFAWVMCVALLGFGLLAGKVAEVFEKGFVTPDLGRLADFKADLKAAAADPHSLAGFDEFGISPAGSAVEAVAGYRVGDDDGAPPPPYVNPWRNVGRNDPCPCGSGKKYKKCCLGARP